VKEDPHPLQEKSRKSGKTKAGQSEGNPPTISEKKLRQLRRRLPGIDDLLAFFSAAGVRVELMSGGNLRINGRQIPPIRRLPPRGTPVWNRVVDEIAFTYVGGEFLKTVDDNAHMGDGLRAFPRRHEKGLAIMHGDVRLATINPTGARIRIARTSPRTSSQLDLPGGSWPTSSGTPNPNWWRSGSASEKPRQPRRRPRPSEDARQSGGALTVCRDTSAPNSSMPALTPVSGSGLSGKSPTSAPWPWSVASVN
jgi:hypothetical protein